MTMTIEKTKNIGLLFAGVPGFSGFAALVEVPWTSPTETLGVVALTLTLSLSMSGPRMLALALWPSVERTVGTLKVALFGIRWFLRNRHQHGFGSH